MPLGIHRVAAQRATGPPRADHLERALCERAGRADRNAHQQGFGRLDLDQFRAELVGIDVVDLDHGVRLDDDLGGGRVLPRPMASVRNWVSSGWSSGSLSTRLMGVESGILKGLLSVDFSSSSISSIFGRAGRTAPSRGRRSRIEPWCGLAGRTRAPLVARRFRPPVDQATRTHGRLSAWAQSRSRVRPVADRGDLALMAKTDPNELCHRAE